MMLLGVFGYVAVDGTTDFSVVIRTLVIRGNGTQDTSVPILIHGSSLLTICFTVT